MHPTAGWGPRVQRELGHLGLKLQETPCWSLQHTSPSPCPCAQPQTASRPGWHARKWQQGTFPRDIMQKEPKSGALGPNLSHWRSQEKINRAVKLRGEFAPEAASDGGPQCQLRSSQWRGCSPSPAVHGGQPPCRVRLAPPGQAGACSARSPFPGQEQGAIQNQFGRALSTLLNTVLISGLRSQQSVAFVPCFVLWLFLKRFQQTFPSRCILTAPSSSCGFLHSKHICLKFKEFPRVPGTLCAMACWVAKKLQPCMSKGLRSRVGEKLFRFMQNEVLSTLQNSHTHRESSCRDLLPSMAAAG